MRRLHWIFAGCLIALTIASAYFFVAQGTQSIPLTIAGQRLTVRLARSPEEQARGLSGTTTLNDSQGMLFIFPRSEYWQFWMKAMHYSLDIVWLDEAKRVDYIVTNAAPSSYPHIFTPSKPARYVLEVPAGFTSRHHVRLGMPVQFSL